jgi:outer membrane protein insertion porin family
MIAQHLIRIFLLFLFSVSTFYSQNQVIKSFKVEGNKVFSQKDYFTWSGVRINQSVFNGVADSIANRILRGLSANGYYFSKINSVATEVLDSSSVSIIVNVEEDSPTIISTIDFILEDSTDAEYLENRFRPIIGTSLNKYGFEEIIQNILTHFENNGYPFIKVTVQSIHFESDSVSSERVGKLVLKVDKGLLSKIDLVEVKGNESTKDYVIIRELRLKKGDLYSQRKIEELPNRLNKLRFFEPVKTPSFYINKQDQGVLVIEVKEKQTNNFDGIIGYIPPSQNEDKGYLTGLVNISLRNLFGTGRLASLKWNKFGRNSQELDLKYLEPWLFNFPFNISLSLYQRIQDTTYVQRRLESNLEYLASETISAALILGTEYVIPTERTIPVFTVFNSSLFTTGLNFRLDTRDDPYSPTEGILFNNTYLFSRKKINGPKEFITQLTEKEVYLQRIISDFEFYYSLFSRQVAALSFHARELRGKSFENTDLFKFGGTNTLRGYREEQFLGNRLLWSNIEYRFLLTARTFVFAFFDFGYYLRQAEQVKNIFKNEAYIYGYGIGLNIETALGVLAVSFALGKEDSFSEGKIHFGIVNEF